jgi:hypothetical protein
MDCLRSFTLNLNQNFSFVAPQFLGWNSVGTFLPWTVESGLSNSPAAFTDFDIKGFKNIDLYGISLVGNCYPTNATASRQGLVQDWGINLQLTGTPPLIGGVFPNNSFGFYQGGKDISLTKTQNIYTLSDPVKSVTQIKITFLRASGIQYENILGIDLTYDLSLICYYKFEGE